ncbi:urea transporter [Phyllosticta citricarpa]
MLHQTPQRLIISTTRSLSGVAVAWRLRHQTKEDYLSSNRTQKAIPLALNFIASGLGSGILFTYPEISTIAGVQGLIVYSLSSGLALLAFGWLGPIIRRKCPEGFVLTEWTRKRYGAVTALYLSVMTLITLFLYMVAELSALQQTITALTGLDGLPAVVVECVVTTIYTGKYAACQSPPMSNPTAKLTRPLTALGGFKVSFITDNIQAAMVLGLILIGVITVGSTTHIDRSLIDSSGLLDATLLGWQLIYILPVAVLTNDFFLSGFWMRTFASRTDKDLKIGTAIASFSVTAILVLVGSTGLLAAWSGALNSPPSADGSISFFLLLGQLPAWVIGIVLVMVVALSTSAFDSFQSAMVSTGSNDLFRNRLSLWWIRAAVVLIMAPTVVVALKSPSVLRVYLISDLVSAALIPVLLIGLLDAAYAWRGFEVVVGGLGGIFTVWLFGTVYYGNARDGANLILLEEGLYADDWSAFGAFVAAPVGGLVWAAAAFVARVACQMVYARARGVRCDVFDDPRERIVETDERAGGGAAVVTTVPKGDVERGRFL